MSGIRERRHVKTQVGDELLRVGWREDECTVPVISLHESRESAEKPRTTSPAPERLSGGERWCRAVCSGYGYVPVVPFKKYGSARAQVRCEAHRLAEKKMHVFLEHKPNWVYDFCRRIA